MGYMNDIAVEHPISHSETQPEFDSKQHILNVVRERAEEVKTMYADKTISNDGRIEEPVKQARNDESGRTCLIAVVRNIQKAFGRTNVPNEEKVLADITRADPIDSNGQIGLSPVMGYLSREGYIDEGIFGDPQKLVEGLLKGGVVITCTPINGADQRSHAKLLAGIRIENGEILLREYDPDPNQGSSRLLNLDQHIEEFYNTDGQTSINLVMSVQEK